MPGCGSEKGWKDGTGEGRGDESEKRKTLHYRELVCHFLRIDR